MDTMLAVLPWALSVALATVTFAFVLRTGRLLHALLANWLVYVLVVGALFALGVISEGPILLLTIVAGWANGLIPGGIAKILFVRRKSIAENSKPISQQ